MGGGGDDVHGCDGFSQVWLLCSALVDSKGSLHHMCWLVVVLAVEMGVGQCFQLVQLHTEGRLTEELMMNAFSK